MIRKIYISSYETRDRRDYMEDSISVSPDEGIVCAEYSTEISR